MARTWKPGPRHEAAAKAAGFTDWMTWIAACESRLGRNICGRFGQTRKAPCEQRPVAGMKVCGFHGGRSKKGPENGRWKDGRYSIYASHVKGKLAENFELVNTLVADAFDLNAEVRVIDAQLLSIVGTLEAGHVTGEQLRKVRDDLRLAVAAGDAAAISTALRALDTLTTAATGADRSWGQFLKFTEAKRRIADTNARQKAKEHGPVTWADVALVVDLMKQGILRYVPRSDLPAFLEWAEQLRASNPAMGMLLGSGAEA